MGAVLDALGWKDYAAVILVNHSVSAQHSGHQTPASDASRNSIKRWMNEQNFRSGGTDFKIVLDPAFATIQVAAGSTSVCQKAIICLADGRAKCQAATT